MSSFLKSASKQVGDVRSFLRESAGGNSIKYSAEKGAKHFIYIPFTSEQTVDEATQTQKIVKKICAVSVPVHEWQSQDGKFRAVACLKDVIRHTDENDPNSPLLNDGTCPICDRVSAAWDIYRYRKELEEQTCQLTGEQRKSHLEKANSQFGDERKAKDARTYLYILVVKFRVNEQGVEVLGADNLPEYELKVMKLSASRVEKIQQQIENSGSELPGSELIFEYPNTEDRRLMVSQSTTAPVFPSNQKVTKYPELLNKINNDIAKFDWDGLDKSFPELAGMSTVEAKSTMDNMFEAWDKYTKELTSNPQAKYLEYTVATPTVKPSINGDVVNGIGVVPQIPVVAPQIPNVAPQIPNVVPQMPNVDANPVSATPIAGVAAPVAQPVNTEPNAVFGGATAPSIQI